MIYNKIYNNNIQDKRKDDYVTRKRDRWRALVALVDSSRSPTEDATSIRKCVTIGIEIREGERGIKSTF